ncbi:MAG: hypothetical protein GC192_02205 [Bacteroidetes bacterium]|nr:hypothetical protein [Bacteroidota bacterium]
MRRKTVSTNRPKVFCIGWHKTGTTTMGIALIELGYKVLGARLDFADELIEGGSASAIKEAGKFDALQDVPWAVLYKELDQAYPGSKFILTLRDKDNWLKSATKHFGTKFFRMHEWIYGEGILVGNEEIYINRFQKHYEDVRNYFAERPEDLLEMDLQKGDSWEKLCKFLNAPIPSKTFPHVNKGRHSYTNADKFRSMLRSMTPALLRKLRVYLLIKLKIHQGKFRNRFHNEINMKYLNNDK